MLETKWTVSNSLIALSTLFTGLTFIYSGIYLFGMNSFFLSQGNYLYWIIQMFTSQFLHGSLLHLLSNSIFILYFGNILERIIGSKHMLLFFICSSIFLGLFLTLFHAGNTVGISGFALAVLTYYTLVLWKNGNPEYTGGVTAIVINIMIGFTPGISFLGHFGGMIFGAVWWMSHQKSKQK